MKIPKVKLLGAVIAVLALVVAPLNASLADEEIDEFSGEAGSGVVDIRAWRDPKPGRGDSVERPVDMSPGKRDAVTDGPRRVWVPASDRDLGCRSGGPDVFRVLAVTSFCRTARGVSISFSGGVSSGGA